MILLSKIIDVLMNFTFIIFIADGAFKVNALITHDKFVTVDHLLNYSNIS